MSKKQKIKSIIVFAILWSTLITLEAVEYGWKGVLIGFLIPIVSTVIMIPIIKWLDK